MYIFNRRFRWWFIPLLWAAAILVVFSLNSIAFHGMSLSERAADATRMANMLAAMLLARLWWLRQPPTSAGRKAAYTFLGMYALLIAVALLEEGIRSHAHLPRAYPEFGRLLFLNGSSALMAVVIALCNQESTSKAR